MVSIPCCEQRCESSIPSYNSKTRTREKYVIIEKGGGDSKVIIWARNECTIVQEYKHNELVSRRHFTIQFFIGNSINLGMKRNDTSPPNGLMTLPMSVDEQRYIDSNVDLETIANENSAKCRYVSFLYRHYTSGLAIVTFN